MRAIPSRLQIGARPINAMMIGSLFSSFGNQLTSLAVPWFVLETTGSASKTGLIAAVTLLPAILATFFGGTIVDRVQRKQLAIGADIISGLTIVAVPFFYTTSGLSFVGLMALMFLGAIFDGPGFTARNAMLPALADRAGIPLEQVNSRFGVIGSATALFGAPIAGLLIAVMGAANVLWLNAATFAISILLMAIFVPPSEVAEPTGNSFVSDVREGMAFIFGHRALLQLALLATAVNFLISPLFGVAIPYFANTVYESSTNLGLMMGSLGFGGLLGSLAYGKVALRWSRHSILILTLASFSIPIWIMALQPVVAVMCLLIFVMGLGAGLVNPMVSTMMQLITPTNMLGRVMGTLGSTSMLATPLGLLLGGVSIGAIGLRGTLLGMAVLFGALLVVGLTNRTFRELDQLATAPARESVAISADSAFAET